MLSVKLPRHCEHAGSGHVVDWWTSWSLRFDVELPVLDGPLPVNGPHRRMERGDERQGFGKVKVPGEGPLLSDVLPANPRAVAEHLGGGEDAVGDDDRLRYGFHLPFQDGPLPVNGEHARVESVGNESSEKSINHDKFPLTQAVMTGTLDRLWIRPASDEGMNHVPIFEHWADITVRADEAHEERPLASHSGASSRDQFTWDPVVRFLARRTRLGVKETWVVQFREGGKTIRRTIGRVSDYSVVDARRIAEEMRAGAPRIPIASKATVEQFVEQFIRDCSSRWKPSTAKANALQLRRRVVPHLGRMALEKVSRTQVIRWHEGPNNRCYRTLSALSQMFEHAELLGHRPCQSNPCKGLRRKQSGFKARFLTEAEYRRLARHLEWEPERYADCVAIIYFLVLTGARRGEVINLRRSEIHGDRAVLGDSKTGPKTIWLSSAAQQLVHWQCAIGSEYVFSGSNPRRMLSRLTRWWRRIRGDAGLGGLRLHDLRHSFASVAASIGEDLPVISRLLGHEDLDTTQGYVHLASAPVDAAASRVSTLIRAALDKTEAEKDGSQAARTMR